MTPNPQLTRACSHPDVGPECPYCQIEELRARVAGLEGRVRGYREMLEHYGQHSYPCASEHGRFPKRCTCGLRAALG